MSYPSPAGEIVSTLDLGLEKFPFLWWAQGARFHYPDAARHLFARCGSAAEAFFLRPFTLRPGVRFTDDGAEADGLTLIPQRDVGKHRVDFALFRNGVRFAIEVDGRAFHHRTAQQVDDDYLRERRVLAAGYIVVRFTAVETFRDPDECWRQLDAIIALASEPT